MQILILDQLGRRELTVPLVAACHILGVDCIVAGVNEPDKIYNFMRSGQPRAMIDYYSLPEVRPVEDGCRAIGIRTYQIPHCNMVLYPDWPVAPNVDTVICHGTVAQARYNQIGVNAVAMGWPKYDLLYHARRGIRAMKHTLVCLTRDNNLDGIDDLEPVAVIRNHPYAAEEKNDLYNQLSRAAACVTFSPTVAVEAMLFSLPTLFVGRATPAIEMLQEYGLEVGDKIRQPRRVPEHWRPGFKLGFLGGELDGKISERIVNYITREVMG